MQKSWMDWFKELPNWIKGAIGLVTVIIGFIILVRDNLQLTILILAAIIVLSLLMSSIYIAFAKNRSTVLDNHYYYRFPRFRKIALLMLGFIPAITIVALFSKQVQSFIETAIIGKTNKLPDCVTVLGLPRVVPDQKSTDKEQILSLIDMENQIYKFGNLEQTMYIFTNTSTINEMADGSWEYVGCEEIKDSYNFILDQTSFLVPEKQKSEIVEVTINGNFATAETKLMLAGVEKRSNPFNQGALSTEPRDILITERWTFMKQEGEWKVKTLIFNREN